MARSHHRPKKHHPQQQHHAASSKPRKKAAPVISIFLGVFGLAIAYFAAGELNIIALIAGAAIGALAGYFIGNNIDKAASKK
jgi:predicted lipid-binding transport protein (Tim44 family)